MFEVNIVSTTIFIVIFTIAFVLMDEYIAKPIRKNRMEKRRATDPVARRALEIAEEAHRDALKRGVKM